MRSRQPSGRSPPTPKSWFLPASEAGSRHEAPNERPPLPHSAGRPSRPSSQPPPLARTGGTTAPPPPSAARAVPAKAIRRDHVLENEITRHRITSFRLVEHRPYVGQARSGRKGQQEARSPQASNHVQLAEGPPLCDALVAEGGAIDGAIAAMHDV